MVAIAGGGVIGSREKAIVAVTGVSGYDLIVEDAYTGSVRELVALFVLIGDRVATEERLDGHTLVHLSSISVLFMNAKNKLYHNVCTFTLPSSTLP